MLGKLETEMTMLLSEIQNSRKNQGNDDYFMLKEKIDLEINS